MLDEKAKRPRALRALVRVCPGCHAPFPAGGEASCASCGGEWLPAALGQARRLVGKGPLTSLRCADCGGALKSIDVPGAVHEGDLFWGHESPRPAGSCVAEGCPRCGGLFVDAGNLQRSGGLRSFREALSALIRESS